MKRFSLAVITLIVLAAISAAAAPTQRYRDSASVSGDSGECALCLRHLL